MSGPIRSGRLILSKLRSKDGGYTLPEMLVAVSIAGLIAGVIGAAFIIGSKTTVEARTRLAESHDAQLLTSYFRNDAASASTVSTTGVPPGACLLSDLPAGTAPVAAFTWADTAGVTNSAVYVRRPSPSPQPPVLIRRYCERGPTVDTRKDVILVGNLSRTVPVPALATCPAETFASCIALPARIELKVTEGSGYNYTVQATPRTDPGGAGPLLGDIKVFVAGQFDGNSHSSIQVGGGGMAYIGSTSCANKAVIDAAGAFFLPEGVSPDSDCAPDGSTAVFTDPLKDIPSPPVQGTTGGNSPGPCYNPGNYPSKLTIGSGCLNPGVYYLNAGADLGSVSVSGSGSGVLLYAKAGNIDLGNGTNLRAMTSGLPTVFMNRDVASQINVDGAVTVQGIIYGARSTMSVGSSNGAGLTLHGAIDVLKLTMSGQGNKSTGIIIS